MTAAHSKNLDFIRTAAVLMVLVRHVLGEFNVAKIGPLDVQFVGIFGVLLFFILTAYVLMFSLARLQRSRPDPKVLCWDFLIRRGFRIYPLSMAVVGIGFLLTRVWEFPGFRVLDFPSVLANLLLVQNLTKSPDIVGTLWSLPIEVQMYLFLPVLFLLMHGRTLLTAGGVYVAALALAVLTYKVPMADVLRYAPCFIPGIIAYMITARVPAKRFEFWMLPVTLAAALVIYGMLGRWSQTLGGYLPCILIGLVFPYVRESQSDFLNNVCKQVAKYSYGIYLIHIPVLACAFALPISAPLRISGFLIVTWVLSVLSYRWIENPMIQYGNLISERKAARPIPAV